MLKVTVHCNCLLRSTWILFIVVALYRPFIFPRLAGRSRVLTLRIHESLSMAEQLVKNEDHHWPFYCTEFERFRASPGFLSVSQHGILWSRRTNLLRDPTVRGRPIEQATIFPYDEGHSSTSLFVNNRRPQHS